MRNAVMQPTNIDIIIVIVRTPKRFSPINNSDVNLAPTIGQMRVGSEQELLHCSIKASQHITSDSMNLSNSLGKELIRY